MHKAMLLLFLCLVVFMGCNEKDVEISMNQQEPGSLDKISRDQTIAGELHDEETSRGIIDDKVMRTAFASLKTSDVMQSYEKVLNLAKKYKGIILNSNISKYDDSDEAQILVKVKPQYFMILLDELVSIGQIESKSITEEDVTEEYFDMRARLTNAHKVLDRLYSILNRANKVEDILKVEKEIERIGEKIEVFEGKLKYLNDRIDYSQISITIYSTKKPFIDLGSIGRGFGNAVKYAIHFFFMIIWVVIIIVPLIGLVLVLKPAAFFIIRRIRRKK